MAIIGMHALMYSKKAEETRAFVRDVLGFASVDAGRGWLIFAAPPAELAIHPAEGEEYHELYLMCDDVDATVADLKAKGVQTTRDPGPGLGTRHADRAPEWGRAGPVRAATPVGDRQDALNFATYVP